MSRPNVSFRQDVVLKKEIHTLVFFLICIVLAFVLQGCGPGSGGPGKMACGDGVPLCGVLVLQSGYGKGPYKHPEPTVHGLWPQTGQYGSSKCVRPDENGSPQQIYSCYNQKGESDAELARFQKHEWDKHGRCAGVDSASDYFRQICQLSSRPIQVMRQSRSEGAKLQGMADALESEGYPVHEIEKGTSEVHLSACAGPSGDWKLAQVADFPEICGSGGGSTKRQCIEGQRGPKCSSDSDCDGHGGCVRCANSGYCTDVQLNLHQTKRSHTHTTGLLARKERLSSDDFWTQLALVNQV